MALNIKGGNSVYFENKVTLLELHKMPVPHFSCPSLDPHPPQPQQPSLFDVAASRSISGAAAEENYPPPVQLAVSDEFHLHAL